MKGLTRKKVEGTVTYILARAFRQAAIEECKSESMQIILERIRLRRKSSKIKIRVEHYWARFYHDGFQGGTIRSKKKVWVFFPKGKDPRRPAFALNEKRKKQVFRFSKAQGKQARARLRNQMIFAKRRKSWKGDPFFDRAAKIYKKKFADILNLTMDELSEAHIDWATGRKFGVTLTGNKRKIDIIKFKHPDPSKRPGFWGTMIVGFRKPAKSNTLDKLMSWLGRGGKEEIED